MRAALAKRFGDLAQQAKLRLGLDVEGEDALLKRVGHLGPGLADAGEGDLLWRDANGEHAAKLAFRHHIHAGAETGERGEHGRGWNWL